MVAEQTRGAEIGRRIRSLRDEMLFTRSELAERSEMSTPAIAKIERGESARPRRTTVEKIAHGFGVPVESLLHEAPTATGKAPAPQRERGIVEIVQDAARAQHDADQQATNRAEASEKLQFSQVRHENQAFLQALEREKGELAEAIVAFARENEQLRRENEQLRQRLASAELEAQR
jgi:transcriptional regulator with XRE-family HTH domain